jgi:hypothetical protein
MIVNLDTKYRMLSVKIFIDCANDNYLQKKYSSNSQAREDIITICRKDVNQVLTMLVDKEQSALESLTTKVFFS